MTVSADAIIRDKTGTPSGVANSTEKLENVDNAGIAEDIHLCAQLADSKDIDEFKERISSIIRQLDFSDFSLIAIEGKALRSLTTMPEDFYQRYAENNFSDHDFLLEHAKTSTTAVFMSDLDNYISCSPFASERIERNKKIFQLFSEYGYNDCYCIPRELQGKPIRLMFSIVDKGTARGEFRRKIEHCKPVLSLLIDAVMYFGISKFPEGILCHAIKGNVAITPKPLRLLRVMAREGLMLKDAATKLCISVDTANKHIAAAKQALGATTLANAVYLAMCHNLIKEDDDDSE